MICNSCRNYINLADKKIKTGEITLEDFKENPDIVYNTEVIVTDTKICQSCQEPKPTNLFYGTKNTCKACIAIRISEKSKDISSQVEYIEKLKSDISQLENFIRQISRDKLVLIISYYKIGRKASDNKDRMVYNIIHYFSGLEKPKNTVKKSTHIDAMVDFENKLDEIIENLEPITAQNSYLYNLK